MPRIAPHTPHASHLFVLSTARTCRAHDSHVLCWAAPCRAAHLSTRVHVHTTAVVFKLGTHNSALATPRMQLDSTVRNYATSSQPCRPYSLSRAAAGLKSWKAMPLIDMSAEVIICCLSPAPL